MILRSALGNNLEDFSIWERKPMNLLIRMFFRWIFLEIGWTKYLCVARGSIPRVLEHYSFFTEQIPQWRASKARIVNFVKMKLSQRMAMGKFLMEFSVLRYILCPLNWYVPFHTIYLIFNNVPKMFARSYPWQGSPTELQAWKNIRFTAECQAVLHFWGSGSVLNFKSWVLA